MAGGSHFPPHPGGWHRQHASRGILHRQTVLARFGDRAAGPAGAARVRDAAARAHEPDPAIAGPRSAWPGSGSSRFSTSRSTGARDCTTCSCCRISSPAIFARCWRICERAGYAFEPEWFAAHFEFRYPVFGRATHAGIAVELRHATEPWYVLGEEPAGGGTTRFVDSSVERHAGEGHRNGRVAATSSPAMAGAFRCILRGRRENGWQACAIARGSRPLVCIPPCPCMRRWFSTWWIRGPGGRWAAVLITWPIRAGGITRPFPSMRMKRKPGERRGFSVLDIRRVRWKLRRRRRIQIFR